MIFEVDWYVSLCVEGGEFVFFDWGYEMIFGGFCEFV